jgi:hypothetical protein
MPALVGNFQFGNGRYTITETGLPDGGDAGTWVLTDATCVGTSALDIIIVLLPDNQVSVVVNGNSSVATCTFTNTFVATPATTVSSGV